MGVKAVTYYTVECDRCGEDLNADSDYSAWGDPGSALDVVADSSGVHADDGLVVCWSCLRLYLEGFSDEDQRESVEEAIRDDKAHAVRMLRYWVETTRTFPDLTFSAEAVIVNPDSPDVMWSPFQMHTYAVRARYVNGTVKLRMLEQGAAGKLPGDPSTNPQLMGRLYREFAKQKTLVFIETGHDSGVGYGMPPDNSDGSCGGCGALPAELHETTCPIYLRNLRGGH